MTKEEIFKQRDFFVTSKVNLRLPDISRTIKLLRGMIPHGSGTAAVSFYILIGNVKFQMHMAIMYVPQGLYNNTNSCQPKRTIFASSS